MTEKTLGSGFRQWIQICFIALFIIGCALTVKCQEHGKQHVGESKIKFEDQVRVRVATVLSVDKENKLIYFSKPDKYELKLFSFGYEGEFKGEGCYVVYYCVTHLMIFDLFHVDCKLL